MLDDLLIVGCEGLLILFLMQSLAIGVYAGRIPQNFICTGSTVINDVNSMFSTSVLLTGILLFLSVLMTMLYYMARKRRNVYGFREPHKYRLPFVLFLVICGILTIGNIAIQSLIFYVFRTTTCNNTVTYQQHLTNLIKVNIAVSVIEFLVIIFLFAIFIFTQE